MSKHETSPGGERFQTMAVRLATYLYLLDIDEWDDLPPNFQAFFSHLTYRDIVAPLVRADYKAFLSKESKFKSAAQIAQKYSIHIDCLRRIVKAGR